MAAGGRGSAKERPAREVPERARLYEARAQPHQSQARRRRRDNIIATSVAGVLVAAAIGGQALFYGVGPGAASDAPAPEETPATSESPAPAETPGETVSPEPTSTPSPTETPDD